MPDVKHIIIVGAGSAGKLLQKDIEKFHPTAKVVGFVDDTAKKSPSLLGTIADLPALTQVYRVDEIIIAIPSIHGEIVRRILLQNLSHRVPITIVPRSQDIIRRGDVTYSMVKPLHYEDFLGRPFVKGDVNTLATMYKDKVVFVTGGAGSIGSEIVRQLLDIQARKVVIYDNSELLCFNLDQELREKRVSHRRYKIIIGSIRDGARVAYAIQQTKPDVIFHVAAFKHVYLMEENLAEAIQNNVLGTRILVQAAISQRVPHFTFVSTDKVVNPQSVMGATKKLAEYYIQSLPPSQTKFTIVRFGNVINSQGSVLPLFERQMQHLKYVTVTDKNMKRFFMSIREAAQLVIQGTAHNSHGHIFILNMGELITIYDVARCLIRSKNLVPEKDIAIKIIGIKKGEKLEEELFTSKERTFIAKTRMPHVWRLKKTDTPPRNLLSVLAKLESLAVSYPNEQKILRELGTIFPSFTQ
ncbi:MAG TPA: polysaccharide biosynthesis protein [Candidatus Andersenbacteria bacterium]|nr:polysaccharide biosynthesis protein [Candidatus Andersenbacteria bacterium]